MANMYETQDDDSKMALFYLEKCLEAAEKG